MSQQNHTSNAAITAIEYYLPEAVVTNAELAAEFPDWQIEKIAEKTGIQQRHIAAPSECSSDLAVAAAQKLFGSGQVSPRDIDVVLLCTQSPDYFLPTTACVLQHRLGIPTSAAALDFNLGCSGFVYGLGLAKGLIETGQARRILFLTAETYSKFLNPCDRNVRVLFGDGAAATLIESVPADGGLSYIEPPVWGTDGRGAPNLIVPAGAARSFAKAPSNGNPPSDAESGAMCRRLYMNGPEVFNFTVQRVPPMVQEVLRRGGKAAADIDLFVFHQASKMLLDHLRRKLEIPAERFCTAMEDCGNTVSSTIPITLKRACAMGMLKPGDSVLLAGFGVGYSWAGAIIRWPDLRAVNSGRALTAADPSREQGGLNN